MWILLSENTNKYVHAKLKQAKDNGDKDPIELLSEGVDQNPCGVETAFLTCHFWPLHVQKSFSKHLLEFSCQ